MNAQQIAFSSSSVKIAGAPAQKGFLSKPWQNIKNVATKVAKPAINIGAAVFPALAPVAVAAQYIK